MYIYAHVHMHASWVWSWKTYLYIYIYIYGVIMEQTLRKKRHPHRNSLQCQPVCNFLELTCGLNRCWLRVTESSGVQEFEALLI